MPSKTVTDKEKSARFVASSGTTHADKVVPAIAGLLTPHLQAGETLPDVALLCRLVARLVEAKAAAMVDADRAHEQELGDDKGPRDTRDRATDDVSTVLADLRDVLSAGYGLEAVKLYGLDGKLPTDPSVVAVLAESVRMKVKGGGLTLPSPRRKDGLQLNLTAYATDLDSALPGLQSALQEVTREQKEADATLRVKHAVMAEYDKAFTRGAGLLSAVFSLADMDDLAGKVRPSRRKPGRTDEPLEGDPTPV